MSALYQGTIKGNYIFDSLSVKWEIDKGSDCTNNQRGIMDEQATLARLETELACEKVINLKK